jgi:hypothetical protein
MVNRFGESEYRRHGNKFFTRQEEEGLKPGIVGEQGCGFDLPVHLKMKEERADLLTPTSLRLPLFQEVDKLLDKDTSDRQCAG